MGGFGFRVPVCYMRKLKGWGGPGPWAGGDPDGVAGGSKGPGDRTSGQAPAVLSYMDLAICPMPEGAPPGPTAFEGWGPDTENEGRGGSL